MSAALVLHRGAVEVGRSDLASIDAPEPTGTWFPIKHSRVIDLVMETMTGAGYLVQRERFGLSQDKHRMFGTFDLATPLSDDGSVTLAVGIRSSTDKSFPLGFCAGSRCFVCDNLAFNAELLVKRKHSRYGETRFSNAIAGAIQTLGSFVDAEKVRLVRLQNHPLTDETAGHYLLRSMEEGIVAAPAVPKVWKEWRTPSFDFGPPTLWRLLNAFTTVLGSRAKTSPNEYAGLTIRLNGLLVPSGPFGLALTHDANGSAEPNAAPRAA
jgi:hypothetical protein